MKKLTHEEFIKRCENILPHFFDYEILTKYEKSSKKIKIKHKNCGYIWNITANSFLMSHKCPKCNSKYSRTTDEFKDEIFNLVGNEYELLDDYVKYNVKIRFKHICGHIYKTSPAAFLGGNRCPICSKKAASNKIRKTTDEFIKEIYDLVKDEYELLDEYVSTGTKIRFKHVLCGNVFKMTPNKFLMGCRCPICGKISASNKLRKSSEQYKQEIFNLVGDEYSVLGEYTTSEQKILMKHNKCNKSWEVKANNFLNGGRRCPFCRESRGEKRIESFLINNMIKYENQKKFDECKNKKSLLFDFYLPEYNICIEYDGIQHFTFENIDYLRNKSQQQKNLFFIDKLINDKIKDDYCMKNKIKLIRIPYFDFENIENILQSFLIP